MARGSGIENIHSFLVLAEDLNYRQAAARLHLDQSALTRRIQKLETTLGFRLLERTTREVTLTQAGQSFYRDNLQVLRQYDESVIASRRIAEGKAGILRVSYMAFAATGLMPQAVAQFRADHPHVDLSLRYLGTQRQKIALANGETDLGFLVGPFDHVDFHCRTLVTEPLYLVAPKEHALLGHAQLIPARLGDYPVILGDISEWDQYRWHLNQLFSAEGLALDYALEASNTLAILGLVEAGLGVTVLPASLIRALPQGLVARPFESRGFVSETVLAWRRSNRSPQLRDFVKIAIANAEASARNPT